MSTLLEFGLYHGRATPEEDMVDWGYDGPLYKDVTMVAVTRYEIIVRFAGGKSIKIPVTEDGLLVVDNHYYGDARIHTFDSEGQEYAHTRVKVWHQYPYPAAITVSFTYGAWSVLSGSLTQNTKSGRIDHNASKRDDIKAAAFAVLPGAPRPYSPITGAAA